MCQALPCKRQHQLLAYIFAETKKLETSEKRATPVLEIEKTGVFILISRAALLLTGLLQREGVIP